MSVILQHHYIAQCTKCDWESVPKLTESAASSQERAHWERVHPQPKSEHPAFGIDWTCEAHGDTCPKAGLDWDCTKAPNIDEPRGSDQ